MQLRSSFRFLRIACKLWSSEVLLKRLLLLDFDTLGVVPIPSPRSVGEVS